MSTEHDGPVLVVGYTVAMQKALEIFQPEGSVVFVDEPDVARKREARKHMQGSTAVRELIDWEYQLPAAADRFYHRYGELRPVAVIPGVEYAVPFAARLAERFGVPGASVGAAELLRDKWLLRQVTREAGITNPRSQPVSSAEELRAVMLEHGGAVVLKPANRQGSVGTRILSDLSEVDSAWAECQYQDEGIFVPDREIPIRMLAEEYVSGQEFSVEMLIRDGVGLFGNVTGKVLFPGPRPVELGHVVPPEIPAELTGRLLTETVRMLNAVGFGSGFVHCEWIVADDSLYLVECAGRMPGDGIIELIEYAWPVNIVPAYYAVMRDEEPSQELPSQPAGGAAVWFMHVEPGEVVSVDGVEDARTVPGVITCDVVVKPGDRTHELRCSWDRIAIVTAHAASSAEALDSAKAAMDRITVKVLPVEESVDPVAEAVEP